MATANKFYCFSEDIGKEVHNLDSDTLKVALSNTAPVAGNAILTDITQITAEHGYSAGGSAVGSNAYSQTAGLAKLTGDNVTFTASECSIGPFRYVVLYNDTATDDPLIAWWDYGTEITLATGQSFIVAWDPVYGILPLS